MKTGQIEEKTVRSIPSMAFLNLALGSMAVSLGLQLAGRKAWAHFNGQWAPTLLVLGVYNKIARTSSEQAGAMGPFRESAGEAGLPVVQ
ncbi:MAG: hypothetical protein FJ086_01110 [Deltaproteobacteria bacterium]|nr:hypothetical protein [Deltaproteobacteria bacterium]